MILRELLEEELLLVAGGDDGGGDDGSGDAGGGASGPSCNASDPTGLGPGVSAGSTDSCVGAMCSSDCQAVNNGTATLGNVVGCTVDILGERDGPGG